MKAFFKKIGYAVHTVFFSFCVVVIIVLGVNVGNQFSDIIKEKEIIEHLKQNTEDEGDHIIGIEKAKSAYVEGKTDGATVYRAWMIDSQGDYEEYIIYYRRGSIDCYEVRLE